jgi:hypothetical protein
MKTKLFDPDARLGHWVALSISLAALAGCGGKVLDVDTDGGKADSAVLDSAIVADTLEIDTFTPAPPVEDSATLPPDTSPSGACTTCLESKCGSALTVCRASAACVAVWRCVDDCSDDACANACIADDSNPGVTLFVDVVVCANDFCALECGG